MPSQIYAITPVDNSHSYERRKRAESVAHVMRALSDPTRIEIVVLLWTCECCTIGVSDLAERIGVMPSNLSYHLHSLWEAGLLERERQQRNVTYWIAMKYAPLVRFLCRISLEVASQEHRRYGEQDRRQLGGRFHGTKLLEPGPISPSGT